MASTINRRKLIKTGMMMAGGLPLISGFFNGVAAKTAPNTCYTDLTGAYLTDAAIEAQLPAEIKARLFANENPFGPSDKAKKYKFSRSRRNF